jgi:hypothetical protein
MGIPSEPSWLSSIQTAQQLIAACKTTQADYAKGLINVTRAAKDSSEWVKQGQVLAKEAKEAAATAKNAANTANDGINAIKNNQWQKLGQGGATFLKVVNIATAVAAWMGAILGYANTQAIKDIIDVNDAVFDSLNKELNRMANNFGKIFNRVTSLEKRSKRLEDDNKTIGLRGQQAFTNSVAARELAEQSRKLGNDALYEARQGRKILDGQIQKLAAETGLKNAGLKQQYDAIVKQIGNNANNSVQQTIKQLQDAQQKATKTVTDSLIKSQESTKKLTTDIQKTNSTVTTLRSGLQQTFNVTQSAIKQVVDKGITPVARASTAWGVTVTPATITPATVTISDGGAVTVTPATVTPATVTPAQFSSSAIGQQVAQQIKQETSGTDAKINTLSGANSNLAQAISNVNADLQNTKKVLGKTDINTIDNGARLQIEQLRRENVEQVKQIQKLNTDLQNEQKMNLEGIQKLNNLLGTVNTIGIGVISIKAVVDAIPSNTINGLKPQIPPLVEQGICNSTRGGCMKGALDQNANDIGNAVNAGNNDLWNKINAGLNGLSLGADSAVMGILNTINGKLGDLIPNGGIAGKLIKGFDWLKVDRALNVINTATTLHNGLMLSNNILQTLMLITGNVLAIIGIKDENGQPFDISSVINATVENFIKGAIGEENYTRTTEALAKANRIYQASMNVLNSLQNFNNVLLGAMEIVGSHVALIGNALKAAGQVAERAYKWFNPAPEFDNPWINQLEKFDNTANSVMMLTQIPLDISNSATELTNATNELIKTVKGEEQNSEPGLGDEIPDYKALKEKQDQARNNSQSPNITPQTIFNGGN